MKHENLFNSRDLELVHLISRDVMDGAAVQSLKSVNVLGIESKTAFMNILQNDPAAFKEPIKEPIKSPSNIQENAGKKAAKGTNEGNERSTPPFFTAICYNTSERR